MMREIKFRTWDEQLKQFHYWGVNVDSYGGHSEYFVMKDGFIEKAGRHIGISKSQMPAIIVFTSPPKPHLSHEQYTGLKDKNGKEAYHNDYWQDPLLPNVLYLIEENPQNGGFKLVCYIEGERIDSMSHTRTDLSCITKGEVVGNIHDNELGGNQ